MLVPAYNEAVGIADTLRSIEASDHDDLEIIVIDDGSTDDTAAVVRALDLPRTRLIEKDNGGKASALNVGLAHATGEVVVMIDGDTAARALHDHAPSRRRSPTRWSVRCRAIPRSGTPTGC